MQRATLMKYAVLALALVLGCSRRADDLDRPSMTETTQSLVPLDQGLSAEDFETSARIRRMVLDEKSLSADAKNAQIVAKSGVVVLRGPVKSEHERQVIADIVRRMPHVVLVDDKLDVAR